MKVAKGTTEGQYEKWKLNWVEIEQEHVQETANGHAIS